MEVNLKFKAYGGEELEFAYRLHKEYPQQIIACKTAIATRVNHPRLKQHCLRLEQFGKINFHLFSQDFHPGPYGVEFFDIAGPFTLSDLNSILDGDLNGDEIVNIQDIILEVSYIIGNLTDIDWFDEGDMNNDGEIDILDIVQIVNIILE